jgi:hypothetical protein
MQYYNGRRLLPRTFFLGDLTRQNLISTERKRQKDSERENGRNTETQTKIGARKKMSKKEGNGKKVRDK